MSKGSAVIYCRVSSDKQVKEGNGLSSQEKRCRDYATAQGYKVLKVFKDEGVSGALLERPGINDLMKFIDSRNEQTFVIIDDLKRLARDISIHIVLKKAIQSRKGILVSPGFNFEDSVEGEFVENIIALTGQLERQQNARQVKNKMRARIESGFWVSKPPLGYKYYNHPVYKKLLVHDEKAFEYVKFAFEGFVNGRFNTQRQVVEYLNENGLKISVQAVKGMLTNILYAGYIESKDLNITRRLGKHEAIISLDTYNQIQDKLSRVAKEPRKSDIAEDFPLRGFIHCQECQNKLSSNWVKGRSSKYPYYVCKQKSCKLFNRNISREEIESSMDQRLKTIKPIKGLSKLAEMVFQDVWDRRHEIQSKEAQKAKEKIEEIKQGYKNLISLIARCDDRELVQEYEATLKDMIFERKVLEASLPDQKITQEKFQTALNTVTNFIENALDMWKSESLSLKRLILKLTFTGPIIYNKKDGFQTTALSPVYQLFESIKSTKSSMVDPIGVEPMTFCVQSRRSSQLS